MRAYFAWLPAQPEQMCSSIVLLCFPDSPAVPEPTRGRFLVHVRIAYTGPAEQGERLLAPLRALNPKQDSVAATYGGKGRELIAGSSAGGRRRSCANRSMALRNSERACHERGRPG